MLVFIVIEDSKIEYKKIVEFFTNRNYELISGSNIIDPAKKYVLVENKQNKTLKYSSDFKHSVISVNRYDKKSELIPADFILFENKDEANLIMLDFLFSNN